MSIITKLSKGSPISVAEADANFLFLEQQLSVKPIMENTFNTRYVVGSEETYNLLNYNPTSYYAINSPTPLGDMSLGTFTAFPVGDGFSLFVVDENKVPISTLLDIEEHLEVAGNSSPKGITYGTVVDENQTLCLDNGLLNTVNFGEDLYTTIYLYFKLYFTINKAPKYRADISTVSRLYFETVGGDIASTIWAVISLDDDTTILDASSLEIGLNSAILDVFADNSCLELWKFESSNGVYNNHDSTNNFVSSNGAEIYLTADSTYYQAIESGRIYGLLTAETITSSGVIPYAGNVPASFSFDFRDNSLDGSYYGTLITIGGLATRYNVEFEFRPLDGGLIQLTFFIHKQAQSIVTTISNNTMVNVITTYDGAGTWECFVDNVSKGTMSLTANFNNSKFTVISSVERTNTSNAYQTNRYIDQLRFFNKALSSVERNDLMFEGFMWVDVVPALASVPTDIFYGTIPTEIRLNNTPVVAPRSLVVDGVDTNQYSFEMAMTDMTTNFDIETTFLNGELGYNTDISGYLEYTRPKNK